LASRFEPVKSGIYIVEYKKENGFFQKETIEYDRKRNQWVGEKPPEFYKENISSWQTVDNSPI